MADTEAMVRKIQACLALANDPGASDAEKALAQQRAEELMAKYEIDEAMMFVEQRGTTRAQDVVLTSFFLFDATDKFVPQARMVLANGLGQTMNCRAVIDERPPSADVDTGQPIPGGTFLTIMGFRNDVDSVKMLYGLVVGDLAMRVVSEKQKSRNYTNEYAKGYAVKILERMESMRRNVTRVVEEKGHGLVLRDKHAAVDDKFSEMYPNLREYKMRSDSRYDAAAQARGRKAAEEVDLTGGSRGVGSAARRELS